MTMSLPGYSLARIAAISSGCGIGVRVGIGVGVGVKVCVGVSVGEGDAVADGTTVGADVGTAFVPPHAPTTNDKKATVNQ